MPYRAARRLWLSDMEYGKSGAAMDKHILELKHICKEFPGVKALDNVNLTLDAGEVLALVGENGAGKSTLMLTLGGVHKPESGQIFIDGKEVSFASPVDAQSQGIGIVYQELSLVEGLSIAENIFANRQPVGKAGFIQREKLNQSAREMLELFHMEHLDPGMLVKDLSIANRQVIEILKAISCDPRILVLDEPTSSLTDVEVQELFRNIRILKERGIGIIYISHHLHEIFEIADKVTILRDGKYICEERVEDIDEEFLVTKMVGRKIENIYGKRKEEEKIGQVCFRAEHLSRKKVFHDVSFEVRQGEIVGMSGLVGAGRTEIGLAIFGVDRLDEGTIFMDGRELHIRSVRTAIANGIGYMSENRKEQGLYLDFDLKMNFTSNRLSEFSRRGFMQEDRIEKAAEDAVNQFRIAIPGIQYKVGKLSGGNQQKVLLATWLGIRPRFLIVDEPTRGVDVGAKSEIYTFLRQLAAEGTAILMISSDLPEILGVSDRILVVREGRIVADCPAQGATEESILSYATGVKADIGQMQE